MLNMAPLAEELATVPGQGEDDKQAGPQGPGGETSGDFDFD